ncbi:MAG: M23 family metallopeptidase [Candidatus Krumholzibacteria bacterium]|nr:M23 family metallopeptidase [Candidatus Krumholzibacteria bacterium]
MTTKIIYSLVGITLAGLTGRGHIAPDRTIDLSFPLRGGTYCIIQGGRNFATNPFHNFVDSEYALDIVRINRLGNRAKDLWPKKVEQYEIFGDTIYSPSQGVVYHTVNTIHDNVPPRANSRHPLGNHVVVSADDARIIVAHLMQGSILVSPGDTLTTGQPIGRVGNSGYSNEPHLHIQALRHTADNPTAGDEPVAVRFGGEFLAINDVVSSR